jgi:hypothetical protein
MAFRLMNPEMKRPFMTTFRERQMRHSVKGKTTLPAAAVLFGAMLFAAPAAAGPIFAAPTGFPAPGGTTFGSSGPGLVVFDPITNTYGRTRVYTGFDTTGASWSQLYFDITGGSVTTNLETMSFNTNFAGDGGFGVSSLTVSGNTLDWLLSGTLDAFSPANGTVSTSVRLVTEFLRMDNTPIVGFFAPTVFGDGMPREVLTFTPTDLLSWGGGFQVRQVFRTGSGQILGPFFNGLGAGAGLGATTGAAFWYDPSQQVAGAVPEPASLTLMGSGLLIAVRKLRRRRAQ